MKMFSNDVKYDFDDILIVPNRSTVKSRKDVDVERTFTFHHSNKTLKCMPVFAANMATTGTIAMRKGLHSMGMQTALSKFVPYDEISQQKFGPWITIGESNQERTRLSNIVYEMKKWSVEPDYNIVIDVANGHRECFVEFCAMIRNEHPDAIIMAGNVCIPEMVSELILHGGVDIVKIQIGPGKNCATRMITGVGYPTASCIDECAHAAHGHKSDNGIGRICSDGGCRNVGDVCKAFALDSDFVMLGSMFAGTAECEGKWVKNGYRLSGLPKTKWSRRNCSLEHYGMSTHHAQEKHGDGKKSHRASEGTMSMVPYKGSAADVAQEILGGIRSCCTYIGADRIKDMPKRASFVRVSKIHNRYHEEGITGS